MVSEDEQGQGQGATPPRRTTGERQRRRELANAALGAAPGEIDTAAVPKIDRFRVVIYLCGAPNADISAPHRQCREYAEAFGWEIVAEIEDREGLNHPTGRAGLKAAIERIERKEAGAVLTPWRSMISPVPREYDEVARGVEKWGGFLHVMDADRARAGSVQ
jgi:hypothetical protein